MTRILSLWLSTLPTDRLARQRPEPDPLPFVTVAIVKGAQRIAAVDRRAAERAVRPGMSLADARAVCPILRVADADPRGEADTLRHILEWARRFTPIAALDAPDGLMLDITGVTHLFGGEASLIEAIEAALSAQGFAATAAIADTAEAAWALARFGNVRLAPENRIDTLAAPLPLAALRLEADVIHALAQAGLRRIGDVIQRPRAPLAARFGEALFVRLDGLRGRLKSPIRPSLPVPAFLAERRSAIGITQVEAIEAAILSLAERLCKQLTAAGQGVRRISALFFRVDGVVKRIAVGTSAPVRDPPRLARLFHEKLESLGEDGLDTGYGFDLIRLEVEAVEPLRTRQDSLLQEGEWTGDADFAALVDRLGARLGFTRVVRLGAVDRHRPEEAVSEVPAFQDLPEKEGDPDWSERNRPLRLFARPEPIEALALVPDGTPARFRWRHALHEIAAVEGPERIAAPWWSEAGPVRDYYQAEDGEGRRFWLFREGLYAETERPRWYVHGLFG